MSIYKNNNGCSIEISPFQDHLFRFTKMKLHESIGGPIAQ